MNRDARDLVGNMLDRALESLQLLTQRTYISGINFQCTSHSLLLGWMFSVISQIPLFEIESASLPFWFLFLSQQSERGSG